MNNRLRVRSASAADINTLEALAREILEQNYSVIGKAQVSFMLDKFRSQSVIESEFSSGYVYYIACFDDVPCGYSSVKKDDTGIYLNKLHVKHGFGHKGVERAMLDQIAAYAKKNKSKRIWLTCGIRSLETYKKLGFNIIDTNQAAAGETKDNYVLEKKLA